VHRFLLQHAEAPSIPSSVDMPPCALKRRTCESRFAMRISRLQVAKMRQRAERVLESAYAPYSGFRVGAAILASNGRIYSGCNVENASYGLTICAERNAIFRAVADGQTSIEALVVVSTSGSIAYPCGACRQVLREFTDDAQIFIFPASGAPLRTNIGELLPNSFGPGSLE
jgi:cytidine deaminase